MASYLAGPHRSVSQHNFAMVPRPDVPRSVFQRDSFHKTSFNAGLLIPMYLDEILPGDSVRVTMGTFTRVSPNAFIYPLMDNLYLDAFFFFVPMRLLWANFRRFMGERTPNTDSSTDFVIPKITGFGGAPVGSLGDYFGLPSDAQVTGTIDVNALPARAYRLVWNEWFRDQNMQNTVTVSLNDGPDGVANLTANPYYRGKRHDYFTAALPFAQKGNPVTIPLGTQAPVMTSATNTVTGVQNAMRMLNTTGVAPGSSVGLGLTTSGGVQDTGASPNGPNQYYPANLYADLSQATAAHINTLRQAAAMQQYLERDARGGTRYTEKMLAHFGVQSPDARLQRPEYIGGGTSRITVNPIAQTSPTEEGSTPLGQLSGVGTGGGVFHANYSATEHGYIMGIVSVRSDLTYQQGLDRLWTRNTVHDFPWPSYYGLGEQPVYRKEIYCTGVTGDDNTVFGYQPRYDEYRYMPSKITGRMRSGVSGTLDAFHLAQNFSAPPVLGPTFISENPPMERVLAGGTQATLNNMQFLCDAMFRVRHVRPMPMFAVPGLVRF